MYIFFSIISMKLLHILTTLTNTPFKIMHYWFFTFWQPWLVFVTCRQFCPDESEIIGGLSSNTERVWEFTRQIGSRLPTQLKKSLNEIHKWHVKCFFTHLLHANSGNVYIEKIKYETMKKHMKHYFLERDKNIKLMSQWVRHCLNENYDQVLSLK